MAWDGAGDRLLLFDEARTLFAISPGGPPRLLIVRDADEIRSVEAIAAYDGNLYVLDPGGGEVWRYLPAGDGYDSERTRVLGGAEIEGATALVVDGDLFVLEPDGVRHFRPGVDPAPLLLGIDRLPGSPAGIVEDVERGRFYVADRAGDRIVVSDRGGDFVAQFLHLRFSNLLGLAISADGMELYVLTGEGIFVFAPGTLDPGEGG
jgi:DNA-binding beta-propeller fold protein YncE